MTVEELIAALSEMPATAHVTMSNGSCLYEDIDEVKYELGEVCIEMSGEEAVD